MSHAAKREGGGMSGRDTCVIGGRAYRAVPARRGCDGCAAFTPGPGCLWRRDTALCNALPPCAEHQRGGGGDVIWITTRGGRPRGRRRT